jgi:cobalt/nickel transport system ATP-binding protein
MLMVTHDLLFAWQLCPRSIVLDRGEVRYDGQTQDLLTNPQLLARFRLELPYGVILRTGEK